MSNDVLVAVFNAEDGSMDAARWTQLQSWLQPDERARADAFKDMEARAAFLIGHAAGRHPLFELV